jgi:hypothetical protein
LIGHIPITVSLADLFDLRALLLVELGVLLHTQPAGACGRQAAGGLRWWGKFSGNSGYRARGSMAERC